MNKVTPHLLTILIIGLLAPLKLLAGDGLVQVHQDFSQDPGWESRDNRVVADSPPTVKQDFGWAPTNHLGGDPGEIGGTIWQSLTPAYYAMPLSDSLSFRDKFSFSVRIAFMPTGGAGAAYLGFFNHQLQGWRVWNSMAVRLGGESGGQAAFGADSMTATWNACGATEGFLHVPMDGKPHTLRFSYDPDATPGQWPDPRLRKYLTGQRQTTEQILAKAQKDERGLTKEELEKRLVDAHAEGLIFYLQRTGRESIIGTHKTVWSGHYWGLVQDKNDSLCGAMIIQLDDMRPFKTFVTKEGHDGLVYMDRFGLLNLQHYHQYFELYISDLTINGHKVDLSRDPGWEGKGNLVQFAEQDFQRQNFGYSETNWAGKDIGEIGGQFTRSEPIDPHYGYYVDEVGKLSLDDPLSFSGNVCFVADSTDSGMQIGFFNLKNMVAELNNNRQVKTTTNTLGILIEGSARGGKQFMPQFTSNNDTFTARGGISFPATRDPHSFKFDYDPKANNNLGRITVMLDSKAVILDLTPQQRADGAEFDRFGVANLRMGGKYVVVYFDDLTYTARRAENYQPVFHKQELVKVPYPDGGRQY